MIHNPIFIIIILVAIELLVLSLSRYERTSGWFEILPPVFFIYFIPMLFSTAGLLDTKAPVLSAVTTSILPMALFLLLVTVDLPAIFRLGGRALGMFFIGAFGMISGAALAFAISRRFVGDQFWGGFAALSASWTGGSANMVAVKEALSVPDAVFLPMVVVDTVVPYVWMGLLIAAVRWQPAFDRWNRADRTVLEELRSRSHGVSQDKASLTPIGIIALLACAAAAGFVSQAAARHLPQVKDMFTTYAWTIIVVSCLGLGLSFTPARRLGDHGATRVGYWLLYFVLTAIGGKASLSNLGMSAVLIAAGAVIVTVHALFLLAGARILRAPLFLVAAASQANIGGVASAPVVAAVYEPGLASAGLLLAILGNIVGTYLGIMCGQFCRALT
ncbi:MAG: DUF819 family protein [Candidatus Omnitrophica bacterium]|nr:DUF819 family protein [Candidatus Omnitrophota bacterium]